MNTEKPVGICPACGEAVFQSREKDYGPVWICPADLSEKNPYWECADERITEALREESGVYSNCGADYGFPCYPMLPLHGVCYDKGGY